MFLLFGELREFLSLACAPANTLDFITLSSLKYLPRYSAFSMKKVAVSVYLVPDIQGS